MNDETLEYLRKKTKEVFIEKQSQLAFALMGFGTMGKEFNVVSTSVSPVEYKSRSGFIPFTSGGAESFVGVKLLNNVIEKNLFNLPKEHDITKKMHELDSEIREDIYRSYEKYKENTPEEERESYEDFYSNAEHECDFYIALKNEVFIYNKSEGRISLYRCWSVNWEYPYFRDYISWMRNVKTCYYESNEEEFDISDKTGMDSFIEKSFDSFFGIFSLDFPKLQTPEEIIEEMKEIVNVEESECQE